MTNTTPAPIEADALRVAAQAALTALENLHEIDTETECITIDVRDEIDALRAALASAAPQPAVQQGDAEGLLIAAVDEWFAKNTGLGGCSDGDVRELRRIFAAHPAAPAPAALAGPSTEQQAAVFREYLNVHEVGGSIGGHAMDAMALDLARIVDALRSRARTNASGQRGEDVAQFVTAARAAKERPHE